MSKEPKEPRKKGFRKPVSIPPSVRKTGREAAGAKRSLFPKSTTSDLPEDLTVPDIDLDLVDRMPVPTSQDQRATQHLSQRTMEVRGAPTIPETAQPTMVDLESDQPDPVDQESDQPDLVNPDMAQATLVDPHSAPPCAEEAALEEEHESLPTRDYPALRPGIRSPAGTDHPGGGEAKTGQDSAQGEVVVLTAEVKKPDLSAAGEEHPSDQMTTADVLEAMEDLEEVKELELGRENLDEEEPGEGDLDQAGLEEEEKPAEETRPVLPDEPGQEDQELEPDDLEEVPEDEPPEIPADADEEESDADLALGEAGQEGEELMHEVPNGPTRAWRPGNPTPMGFVKTDANRPSPVVAGARLDISEEDTSAFESPWASRKDRGLVVQEEERDILQGYASESQAVQPFLEGPSRLEILPVQSIDPDPSLVLLTAPGTSAAEQYRVLALKLKENINVRTICITGPTSEVGAEVVAVNLALALAEGSRSRVCLVDGDLRRSSLCRLFGMKSPISLGEELHQHLQYPERPWRVLGLGPALHLLPSPKRDANPAEVLNSEAIWDLMDELRREFDYVVLTTPPLLESADGVILQEHADGIILAARSRMTRQDNMRGSLEKLGKGKVLGTVLLDVEKPTLL